MSNNSDRKQLDNNRKKCQEAFDQLAADPAKKWDKDGWGGLCSWEALSATSKVAWIAAYAAVYDVAFERFAETAQKAVGERPLGAPDQWTLRGQYEGAVAFLGPDDAVAEKIPERVRSLQPERMPAPVAEAGKEAVEKALDAAAERRQEAAQGQNLSRGR